MSTAAASTTGEQSVPAVVGESYEDWLTRTVDAMPEFTERQQRELRELLRPTSA